MNEPAKKLSIEELVVEVRALIQEGVEWNNELAQRISTKYYIDFDKANNFGVKLYDKFSSEFDVKNGSVVQKIEFFLNSKFEFKRNIISNDILFREKEGKWSICKYNDIWRYVHHNLKEAIPNVKKPKIAIGDIINLLESSFVPEYNPFKEYFESLPEWDEIDHITALANHITCEDQNYWLAMFKKALVRMIACSYGMHENRIINVLVQEEQEQGKDTFIRFLCPPELHGYYKEDPLEINKDSEIALAQNFIWNLAELDHLNKKEISEIKSIISRKVVKQRAAFARQAESRPRVVNWWGSTNKVEFLTDDQHTRWLCFIVKKISWAYSQDIDIQKVWAQAWHLYRNNFDYNLSADEKTVRNTKNKDFEFMPDEKQLILTYLQRTAQGEGEFMISTDIQMFILAVTANRIRINAFNISKSMKQLGFVPDAKIIGATKVRGFWARKKPPVNGQALDSNFAQASLPLEVSPDPPF